MPSSLLNGKQPGHLCDKARVHQQSVDRIQINPLCTFQRFQRLHDEAAQIGGSARVLLQAFRH